MTVSATRQVERARVFRAMHGPTHNLLLPNAWDAVSGRLFAQAGFPALGTTSAGIAWTRGYPDGQHIGRDAMLAEVARIVAAVDVPVTADIEAGYGPRPEDVAETVRGVIEIGAVGVNLEDGADLADVPLLPADAQAERLEAARESAARTGVPLFLNARTDVYLAHPGDAAERLAETKRRAAMYLAAGADAVFVPGVVDPPTVAALVQAVQGPLNVMVGPGAPPVPELFALGVARVSIGGAATLAVMGFVRKIARELRDTGTVEILSRPSFGFREAQALLAGSHESARASTASDPQAVGALDALR